MTATTTTVTQLDFSYSDTIRAEVDKRIEQVRDTPLTLAELASRWGVHADIARRYLRECSIRGTVVEQDRRFTIGHSSEVTTRRAWRDKFLAELVKRRKENNDRRGASRWDPVQVNLAIQRSILDFVEVQLEKFPL